MDINNESTPEAYYLDTLIDDDLYNVYPPLQFHFNKVIS